MQRLLISAGGSGGHFFPALAVAEALQRQFPSVEIIFIGSTTGIEHTILSRSKAFPMFSIPSCRFYRMPRSAQIVSGIKLIWGVIKALWLILRYRPFAVLGSGSFISAPVLLAAFLLRRPIIVQEQNVTPGITNRYFGKVADLCLLAHPPRREADFKRYRIVGNPIRREIETLAEAAIVPKKPTDRLSIYLIGGSQGATLLNQALCECLPLLEQFADTIRITHQTGKKDFDTVSKAYQTSRIPHQVQPFIYDMPAAYNDADIIISRSGSIIVEYTAAGKPSVLIPITHSSGNHQRSNADVLVNAGAALLITEQTLTGKTLFSALEGFIRQPDRLHQMALHARSLYRPDSAENSAALICELFMPQLR